MSDEVAALREQLRAAEARLDEYKAKLIAASQEIHNAQMAQAAAESALALLREAVNANACTDDEHGEGCECRPSTIIERQQSALAEAREEIEGLIAERDHFRLAVASLTAERDEWAGYWHERGVKERVSTLRSRVEKLERALRVYLMKIIELLVCTCSWPEDAIATRHTLNCFAGREDARPVAVDRFRAIHALAVSALAALAREEAPRG